MLIQKMLCGFLFSATLHGLGSAAVGQVQLKYLDWRGADHPSVVAVGRMSDHLRESTHNSLAIEFLEFEADFHEAIQRRAHFIDSVDEEYDMTTLSTLMIASKIPTLQHFELFSLPYIFRSPEHMHNVLDGTIGAQMLADFDTESNSIGLAYFETGASSFYSNVPLASLDDLKGKMICSRNGLPAFNQLAVFLGMQFTASDCTYLMTFTYFRDGRIDVAEAPLEWYLQYQRTAPYDDQSISHYKIAPYVLFTAHMVIPEVLVISKKAWEKLDESQRQSLREAAALAAQQQHEFWEAYELGLVGYVTVNAGEIDRDSMYSATSAMRHAHATARGYVNRLGEIEAQADE